MIDLDNNGIAELFIADVSDNAPEQYVVYGIFTCVDGKPAELFGNSDMGGLANWKVMVKFMMKPANLKGFFPAASDCPQRI